MNGIIFVSVSDSGTKALNLEFKKGSQCPWGTVQSRRDIKDGICFVSTAGHGGYMFRSDIAASIPIFPKSERFLAAPWQGGAWYAFEEDCASYVAEWLMMNHFPESFERYLKEHYPGRTMAEAKEVIHHGVKTWYPHILETK